jgi:hypothetical protein
MTRLNSRLLIFIFGIFFQGLILFSEIYQVYFYTKGKIIYGVVIDVPIIKKNKLIYYIDHQKIEKMVKLKVNSRIKLICIPDTSLFKVYNILNFILGDIFRLLVFVGMIFFLKHFYKNELYLTKT